MGRDKALLTFGGEQTQLERTVNLLNEVADQAYVSLRKDLVNFLCSMESTPSSTISKRSKDHSAESSPQ